MKKIGILLAILLIAGVCAMADDAVPAVQGAVLFADVDAVALSQAEMDTVEGEGFGSGLLGAFSGAVVGAMVEAGDMCIRAIRRTENRTGKQMARAMGEAATKGAIGGFAVGFFAPAP